MSSFENLRFEDCCRSSLREIRSKLDTADGLKAILLGGTFLSIISDSPPFNLFSLSQADFAMLDQAIKAVPLFIRKRCVDIIERERYTHPCCELYRFWTEMQKSFEGQ